MEKIVARLGEKFAALGMAGRCYAGVLWYSSVMNEKTEGILEFDAIRSRVACCSFSEEAKRRILAEKPLVDPDDIRRLKGFVSETVERMKSGDEEKQESLPDIGFLLPKLAVEGASLEPDEAFAIGLFVERGWTLKHWLVPPSSKDTPLRSLAETIPDCTSLAREVFRIFNKDGSLKDLPEFQEINRRIRRLAAELEAAVSRYAGNEESRRMLQSTVPSQRDGRAVLAVKANFRGRIRGIVHEVSATGQTLFIEPEDVVEKNNDILIEKRRLDAEVLRVLRELTTKIAEGREILADFHEKIIGIEIIRAKARYSKDIQGVFAKESENGARDSRIMTLKQARHPLLGRSAVPVDFSMNEGKGAVVITGPNTGGKTVSLKTVGLFALMNQSGLAVSAAEGTSLPVFDDVFADIGDEQSISQSLSTFSAHMINIAAITASASSQSLVLLDELGSGTDPEEGSAIAMAILDFLIEKRVSLIVTTHHGVLKNYGYTREYVENASVEFDSRTLSPTYRIVMGIPGESRAVDIASRNGLQAEIIAKAHSYLNEERADVSSLIAGLKRKHRELDAAAEERRQEEKRLREERRAADLKELRLRQKEVEIKSGEVGKLRKLLDESRKTLENLVREVKEREITRERTLKVKDFLNDLEKSVANEANSLDEEERTLRDQRKEHDNTAQTLADSQPPPPLVEGAEALVASYGQRGTIIRQEKNGWLVEIGSLRMTFPAEELTPVRSAQSVQKQLKPALVVADLSRGSSAVMELNLLGMRLEEALEVLQRQIDDAVLSGLKEFAVIHGKGGGVLQKGVHDFLKKDQRIADFHFSRPELGGFGRTEVALIE
ncbi:MAG: endonuclease MutS2 [Treponema sp.]|jgi:DNA mismatch repair protein MutS2|nr:endonuclease MutS2 [Treponema sp.]